jgi:hypothetical protein
MPTEGPVVIAESTNSNCHNLLAGWHCSLSPL